MNKSILIALLAVFSIVSNLKANDCCDNISGCHFKEIKADLGYGYRRDRLNFDTLDASEDPSLSYNREYEHININMIVGSLKAVTCNNVFLRFQGDYGWVDDGSGETDYLVGSTLTDAYTFHINDNYVWDVNLALGYQFSFCCDAVTFTPLVGYSWHKQKYNTENWIQTLTNTTLITKTQLPNYKEQFSLDRNGFWVGFDLSYTLCSCWSIGSGFEWHQACFTGKNNWPTDTTIVPNTVKTETDLDGCGHGWLVYGNVNYNFYCNWNASVYANYQSWFVDDMQVGLEEFGAVNKQLQTAKIDFRSWTIAALIGYTY